MNYPVQLKSNHLQPTSKDLERVKTSKKAQFAAIHDAKKKAILDTLGEGLVHPNKLSGGVHVRMKGNKMGFLTMEFGQDTFYKYDVKLQCKTRGGKEKALWLGTTHSMTYDLGYTQFLVNVINENRIKEI